MSLYIDAVNNHAAAGLGAQELKNSALLLKFDACILSIWQYVINLKALRESFYKVA
jgi:hypothetical protein